MTTAERTETFSVSDEMEKAVGVGLEELTAIYILGSIKGFGPQKFKELHANGITPTDIVQERKVLPTTGKRGDAFRQELVGVIDRETDVCRQRALKQISIAYKANAHIITFAHPLYPKIVLESNNPVPLLYIRGNPEVLQNDTSVACVGSRQIREPYILLHKSFAEEACRLGFSVVSGFALGADTIGHQAAKKSGGKTVCVMPSGLDRPFPPENKSFWQELLEYDRAALVSEFPFGTGASSLTLRKRNKLIVSFALGVLVSQSSVTGGAMNAYRIALEQRKPIASFADDNKPDSSGNAYIVHKKISDPSDKENLPLLESGKRSQISPSITSFPLTPQTEAYDQWLRALSSSI